MASRTINRDNDAESTATPDPTWESPGAGTDASPPETPTKDNLKPAHPIAPDKFMSMRPSSAAEQPRPKPPGLTFNISIQRQEGVGTRRWREIASWSVVMEGEAPMNCELRLMNYRMVVSS